MIIYRADTQDWQCGGIKTGQDFKKFQRYPRTLDPATGGGIFVSTRVAPPAVPNSE